MPRQYYVYILASHPYGTLYIGVTSDLPRRIWDHKHSVVPSFTSKHDVKRLVYFETHDDPYAAITREKQIKHWKRNWKVNLIQQQNPQWRDLFEDFSA